MSAYELIGYPLILLSLFQATLTIICFSRSRGNKFALITGVTVFTASVYSLSAGLAYLQAGAGIDYSFAYRNCWIGWVTVPAVQHLIVHISNQGGIHRKLLVPISYVFWIVVWILAISTTYVDLPPAQLIPYQEVEAPFEKILRAIAMVQTLYCVYLVAVAYRTVSGARKQRIQYLLFGFATNAFAAIVTSSLMQLAFDSVFDPALTSFFGILLSAPLFYSMTQLRLFDIRVVVSRVVSTVILTVMLGILHYAMLSFFMKAAGFGISVVLSSALTGLLLFFTPALDWARAFSFRQLSKRSTGTHLLKDLSGIMITSTNTDDLFRRFGDRLRTGLGIESICFYTAEENDYALKHCSGESAKFIENNLKIAGDGVLSKILLGEKQIFVKDEYVQTDLYGVRQNTRGILSELDDFANDELLVPLAARGSVVGIMAMGLKADAGVYSREDLSVLEAAGSQIGLAIENARLFEQAVGDGLTGLYHQKYFKIRLQSEIVRARRHGNSLGLLILDADHFKAINDNFGHVVGDHVLQGIAGVLKSTFRGEDVLARYGGEEFAILLIEPSPTSVMEVAERLRRRISEQDFHQSLKVTVSIGAYIFDPKNQPAARQLRELDVIDRADKALYRAKHSGRDRVCLYDENDTRVQSST